MHFAGNWKVCGRKTKQTSLASSNSADMRELQFPRPQRTMCSCCSVAQLRREIIFDVANYARNIIEKSIRNYNCILQLYATVASCDSRKQMQKHTAYNAPAYCNFPSQIMKPSIKCCNTTCTFSAHLLHKCIQDKWMLISLLAQYCKRQSSDENGGKSWHFNTLKIDRAMKLCTLMRMPKLIDFYITNLCYFYFFLLEHGADFSTHNNVGSPRKPELLSRNCAIWKSSWCVRLGFQLFVCFGWHTYFLLWILHTNLRIIFVLLQVPVLPNVCGLAVDRNIESCDINFKFHELKFPKFS